jgi:hypothetical protein
MDRTENIAPLLLCHYCVRIFRGSHATVIQSLTSNGCCIVAYIAIVSYQQVYMPRYFQIHVIIRSSFEIGLIDKNELLVNMNPTTKCIVLVKFY